jgi:hypothetical protein
MRKAALLLLFAGCTSGPPGGTPDAGDDGGDAGVGSQTCDAPEQIAGRSCVRASQCCDAAGQRGMWACFRNTCARTCTRNADCGGEQVCDDGVCVTPSCASSVECNRAIGEICLAGKCQVPPREVDACFFIPERALIRQGATRQFIAVALEGNHARSVDADAVFTSSAPAVVSIGNDGIATGGATGGAAEIRAKLGGTDCTTPSGAQFAVATNYTAPATGKVRVLVGDGAAGGPLAGATVTLDGAPVVTGANGVAEFTVASGAHDVGVFKDGYDHLSVLRTTGTDLALFVRPTILAVNATGFKGTLTGEDFEPLKILGGEVHMAFHGASVPGSLLDFEPSHLIGRAQEVTVDFGQGQPAPLLLPENIVFGMGTNMFKGDWRAPAVPGLRTLWGLGGNIKASEFFDAVGPAIEDPQNADVGQVAVRFLPLMQSLQSGALTAQPTPGDGQFGARELTFPNDLLLSAQVKVPPLPAGSDGALAIAASLYRPQGFVALGLTAGLDADEADARDGLVNNIDDRALDGTLRLRFAPAHSGMEDSPYAVIEFASSLASLGLYGPGRSSPFTFSALAVSAPELRYDPAGAVIEPPRPFLDYAEDAELNARTVTMDTTVASAHLYRLRVVDGGGRKWFIYFPASHAAAPFELPLVPQGFTDRTLPVIEGETAYQSSIYLEAVRLSPGIDYEGIWRFDERTNDDLALWVEALSAYRLRP